MQLLHNGAFEQIFPKTPGVRLHQGAGSITLPRKVRKNLGIVTYSAEDLALLTALLMVMNRRRAAGLLAKSLLVRFGSLPKVLCAAKEDIRVLPGMGAEIALVIERAYSAILRTVALPILGGPLMDMHALTTMLVWVIGQGPVEVVQLIYLDSENYVTGSEVICSGSETCVSVSLRTILRAAIRQGAYAIVVAHNHPGGRVDPSDYDLGLTSQLKKAGLLLGIGIRDHIIVSGERSFSFRSIGYLDG